MEPITLLGVVIAVFGLWVEFEPMVVKVARAITCSIDTALTSSTPVQKPVYVKYLSGIGT